MRKLSLAPYNGQLFLVRTAKAYEKAHRKLFKARDKITVAQAGRFFGGEGKNRKWTYLVWASEPHILAHELAHVVFHVFERCGVHTSGGNDEPFCYLLSQLILDASKGRK